MQNEEYTWLVELVDGRFVKENDIPFREVMELNRQGKVRFFNLVKNGATRFVVTIGGKRKLIFARRRMNHVQNKGSFQWTLTYFGWEENVRGVSAKTILYVYPNGGVELNNDEPALATAYHNKLISQFEGIQSMNSQSNEILNI